MSYKKVDDFFLESIKNKFFTGASVLASKKSEIFFYEAYGFNSGSTDIKTDKNTFFDLASLTKPLATAVCFQLLWQDKKIYPEDYVSRYIPEFKCPGKNQIKIENLLLHNSGLPAHRHYYKNLCDISFSEREKTRISWISREELVAMPGIETVYSDLGFMILKNILEKTADTSLYEYLKKNLYDNKESSLFFSSKVKKNSNAFCETSFSGFRNKRLKGEVDDDNAFSVGGEDGHAGLFGTCLDVHKIIDEFFGAYSGSKNKILYPDFTKRMLKIRNSKRAFGFDSKSLTNSSCGDYFSSNTVGHLGFTGTSMWIDLDHGLWIILLTNRVFYGDNNDKIKYFRPRLHNLLYKLA
ncbi:MAG: serine hydrolase [Desulfobacteraceae bacterium]|nr:serine hydrolase [Desulfobacteraceae bacterium]MCB9494489.1 serine hydrolase [Desulfobacteraceae bacterium]